VKLAPWIFFKKRERDAECQLETAKQQQQQQKKPSTDATTATTISIGEAHLMAQQSKGRRLNSPLGPPPCCSGRLPPKKWLHSLWVM
jgi:hypothetical protein